MCVCVCVCVCVNIYFLKLVTIHQVSVLSSFVFFNFHLNIVIFQLLVRWVADCGVYTDTVIRQSAPDVSTI